MNFINTATFLIISGLFNSLLKASIIESSACTVNNPMDLNEKDPCYLKTKYYCCATVTNRYPPDHYITINTKQACVPAMYHDRIFEYKEPDFYIKTHIKCLLYQPWTDLE